MDKRIAIPAGLAIMVALAVVGMLSIFSYTATQPAEASISEISQGIGNNVVLAKLEEPFSSPIQATGNVTGSGAFVTFSPQKPSTAASYTFTFFTPNILQNGVDEIIIQFEDDFTVPSPLDRNQITISANALTNGGSAGQAIAPQEVTIDLVGVKFKPEISMRVPDLDVDDNSGGNGAALGALITVIIRQGAQIITPSENDDDYEIEIRVTNNGVDPGSSVNTVFGTFFVPAFLEMDSDDAKRGDQLTVIARGVEGNESITFFRDGDLDGIRDANERDLCTVQTAGSDIATCTFNISNPPFDPGFVDTVLVNTGTTVVGAVSATANIVPVVNSLVVDANLDLFFYPNRVLQINAENLMVTAVCTLPGVPVAACTANHDLVVIRGVTDSTAGAHANLDVVNVADVNFINFVDSENRQTTGFAGKNLDAEALARQNLELDQTTEIQPSSAAVGDRVTISLFDFKPGGVINKITIGNIEVRDGINDPIDDLPAATVLGSGQVSFTFEIPGRLENNIRTPTGKVPFKIFTNLGDNEEANVTIGGAKVTLSHSTIVPNQDLTITGSGFSENTNACIEEGNVTINNVAVEIDDDTEAGCVQGIRLSSGGTFTLTVRVEQVNIGNNPLSSALMNEGTVQVKVIDTDGIEGTFDTEILERVLTVNPLSARPRDNVTITGRNFVADNSDGLSATVRVRYECTGSSPREATADPDASGNFREVIRIPSNCAIPSTNTITATILANGETGIVETATHEIPEALVRIDPIKAAPGDLVSVSGEGFRTFETVSEIEFGDLQTLGGRTVNTDGQGNFTVDDILVPGEDPGVHAVKVKVGATTASTSFEILESSAFGRSFSTPIDEYLEDLLDDLDRAFLFDNNDKVWDFFINDDDFLDANTLMDIPSDAPLWLKVTGDVSVEINGVPFDLTCINFGTPEEDCWNQIVTP